jgi:hypothetical protein
LFVLARVVVAGRQHREGAPTDRAPFALRTTNTPTGTTGVFATGDAGTVRGDGTTWIVDERLHGRSLSGKVGAGDHDDARHGG